MKIKTAEMTELQIDWAVAECEGCKTETWHTKSIAILFPGAPRAVPWSPSTNSAQGWPIIDRMGESGLILMRATARQLGWRASLDFPNRFNFGPTSLIAAMRCYVASKLGDEVDIPEELV